MRWGPAWASGSRQESSFPTATAIYLCLGPPGRSDTNGITLTGRQGAEKRIKRGVKLRGRDGGEEGKGQRGKGGKVCS